MDYSTSRHKAVGKSSCGSIVSPKCQPSRTLLLSSIKMKLLIPGSKCFRTQFAFVVPYSTRWTLCAGKLYFASQVRFASRTAVLYELELSFASQLITRISQPCSMSLLRTVFEFIRNYFWWISEMFVNYINKMGENQCWSSPIPILIYMEIYAW